MGAWSSIKKLATLMVERLYHSNPSVCKGNTLMLAEMSLTHFKGPNVQRSHLECLDELPTQFDTASQDRKAGGLLWVRPCSSRSGVRDAGGFGA